MTCFIWLVTLNPIRGLRGTRCRRQRAARHAPPGPIARTACLCSSLLIYGGTAISYGAVRS
eukprot:2234900-Pleurochrysis_carterae.AAC.1